MENSICIEDHTIWFKMHDASLRERLQRPPRDDETINPRDGRRRRAVAMYRQRRWRTDAIKPDGEMKKVWNDCFRTRKGETIELREAVLADDYLAAGSALFSEWNSPEDEEAFP